MSVFLVPKAFIVALGVPVHRVLVLKVITALVVPVLQHNSLALLVPTPPALIFPLKSIVRTVPKGHTVLPDPLLLTPVLQVLTQTQHALPVWMNAGSVQKATYVPLQGLFNRLSATKGPILGLEHWSASNVQLENTALTQVFQKTK